MPITSYWREEGRLVKVLRGGQDNGCFDSGMKFLVLLLFLWWIL